MQHTRRGRKESEPEFNVSGANPLGEAVRTWRHQRGLTVTELAVQSGFGISGRSYISKVEHGAIRRLGARRLRAIADALRIRLEDLLPRAATTDRVACSPPLRAESDVAQIDAWSIIDQALSTQPTSTSQGADQRVKTANDPFPSPNLPFNRASLTGETLSANVNQMIDGFLLKLEVTCQVQIHRFIHEEVRSRLLALMQEALPNEPQDRDDDPSRPQPLPDFHDPPAEESSCTY